MSRYTYTNLNWRDQTNRWEWSEAYAGWLTLAEIQNKENACRTSIVRSTATDSRSSSPAEPAKLL